MFGFKKLEEDLPMSSNEFAIKVSNLSKCYEVYSRPADRLKQFIYPSIKRLLGHKVANYYREFWALKNVSFDVRRGEAVGIVGRNGAGKSTLLQLIAGTLAPTSGEIEVNGRVAALLELGSGFNPEFTGRENVYLNASILGLSENEVDQRFEEIAAFADIGDFIDQPLSTYSSGMMMRLAFAVNTCVSPDILIVDEALGVGDAPFQAKCFKRLRELAANGTSLLFVSHDIEIVRSLCNRALWLKNGIPENWGEAKEVTKGYERYCWVEQGVELPSIDITTGAVEECIETTPPFLDDKFSDRSGTLEVLIKKIWMTNTAGEPTNVFDYDEIACINYIIKFSKNIDSDFVLGIRIKDLMGNFIYSLNDLDVIDNISGVAGDEFIIQSSFKVPFSHQDYILLTGIFGFEDGNAFKDGNYDFARAIIWDLIDNAIFFSVRENKKFPISGPVQGRLKLNINKK